MTKTHTSAGVGTTDGGYMFSEELAKRLMESYSRANPYGWSTTSTTTSYGYSWPSTWTTSTAAPFVWSSEVELSELERDIVEDAIVDQIVVGMVSSKGWIKLPLDHKAMSGTVSGTWTGTATFEFDESIEVKNGDTIIFSYSDSA